MLYAGLQQGELGVEVLHEVAGVDGIVDEAVF